MPLPASYLGGAVIAPQIVKGPRGAIQNALNLPLQAVLSQLVKASFVDVAAIVTDAVSASHLGAAAAGTTSQVLDGTLGVAGVVTFAHPRNVVITVTHATAVVAMSGVITGTDQYGRVITEAWAVTAATTSKTFTGKKAFKTVTSTTEVVAADASANTIISGNGKVLGLPFRASVIKPIAELEDAATPTVGVIVAGSAVSTADFIGTYTPNSAPNGALDFTVWYIVDDFTVQP